MEEVIKQEVFDLPEPLGISGPFHTNVDLLGFLRLWLNLLVRKSGRRLSELGEERVLRTWYETESSLPEIGTSGPRTRTSSKLVESLSSTSVAINYG